MGEIPVSLLGRARMLQRQQRCSTGFFRRRPRMTSAPATRCTSILGWRQTSRWKAPPPDIALRTRNGRHPMRPLGGKFPLVRTCYGRTATPMVIGARTITPLTCTEAGVVVKPRDATNISSPPRVGKSVRCQQPGFASHALHQRSAQFLPSMGGTFLHRRSIAPWHLQAPNHRWGGLYQRREH